MDFLWELVPEATIVHIKRHPVAVVASHVDQPWGPPTVDGALAWLKPVYDRWLAWKTTVDLTGKRYVEVRAEDLAANWPEQRRAPVRTARCRRLRNQVDVPVTQSERA
jgi:omega-hydroxy-beta-dihydromenaquinone-9 sulfotransferase